MRKQKREKYARLLLKSKRVSEGFESSWYSHCRMFGDILEPAFADDLASRLELTAALNLISRGRCAEGVKKLEKLRRCCVNDADLAAWNFFMGVCFEKSGLGETAAAYYGASAAYEPDFYMVYLMLARCLHAARRFEAAAGAYAETLERILARPRKDEVPAVREKPLLGSVHGNLAACLLMMRRYDDAEYELYEAQRCEYEHPQLTLTWAMLYAATGRRSAAAEKMSLLKKTDPALESSSALRVMELVERKNPHFAPRAIDAAKIESFWSEFCEDEQALRALAFGSGSPELIARFGASLARAFDFGVERPGFDFGREGAKARLSFSDNYNLSFELWLERLVDTAPAQLKGNWSFYAVH